MEENTNEMLKHLDNILVKIDLLSKNVISEQKYNLEDLERVKNIITQFKDILKNKKNIFLIDLEKLKEISNIIFELNCDNLFSDSTDYISNELYAFEFLLQEKWKEVRSMSKEQAINKLFFDFIKTLNLVFADDFYKNTFELKKVKEIMDKWYFDFKKEKTLINISLQDIKFLDLEITDFFDKYIEDEDASHNYTEILSFNLSQLEKFWKDEFIEKNKKNG